MFGGETIKQQHGSRCANVFFLLLFFSFCSMVVSNEPFELGVKFGMEICHQYVYTLRIKYCLQVSN